MWQGNLPDFSKPGFEDRLLFTECHELFCFASVLKFLDDFFDADFGFCASKRYSSDDTLICFAFVQHVNGRAFCDGCSGSTSSFGMWLLVLCVLVLALGIAIGLSSLSTATLVVH